ncbi:MAG: hypothetical protein GX958_07665, partial [Desulfitobacterium sp.]|nr:hypothetical protein [Desulfitobacterium sp.]
YDLEGACHALLRYVTDDLEYFRDLARTKEYTELYMRIISSFRDIRLKFIPSSDDDSTRMFFIQTFLNGGVIATLFEWLHSESEVTPDEILKIVEKICDSCHKNFHF